MFLSAVWTLILMAPIHCRGSIGEQVLYRYVAKNLNMLKKLIFSCNLFQKVKLSLLFKFSYDRAAHFF